MKEDIPFVLPPLTRWGKSKMLGYAEQALTAQQAIVNNTGKNILHYTLEKKRRHTRMTHYPKSDRIDLQTGAQYFYHCHRENKESAEHGHFHCFLRYKNIPKRIKPTPLADWDKHIHNPMTHIVAIALNRYSQPIRLFTVNRWISSEIWYDAKYAPYFIKRFNITLTDSPHWQLLDRWIEAMLKLFSPQIAWLHQERDAMMANYQINNPDRNVYDDENLEETSQISIDFKNQIEWVLGAN